MIFFISFKKIHDLSWKYFEIWSKWHGNPTDKYLLHLFLVFGFLYFQAIGGREEKSVMRQQLESMQNEMEHLKSRKVAHIETVAYEGFAKYSCQGNYNRVFDADGAWQFPGGRCPKTTNGAAESELASGQSVKYIVIHVYMFVSFSMFLLFLSKVLRPSIAFGTVKPKVV